MSRVRFSVFLLISLLFFSYQSHAELEEKNPSNKSFVENTPSDFKPSFTEATVIKLNGIVSRSLEMNQTQNKR